jgi:hypothetical protein
MEFRTNEVPSVEGKTIAAEVKGSTVTIAFGENGEATVSGGEYGQDAKANYARKDQWVWIKIGEGSWIKGLYDGERLAFGKGEVQGEVTYIINCDF